MPAASRGLQAVSADALSRQICTCGLKQPGRFTARRSYSASPVVQPADPGTATAFNASSLEAPDRGPPKWDIRAGIILTRAPLLSRELTPFESSFFLYQKRLNERLSAAFRRRFYFRPDTAADLDWIVKVRERRGTAGRDIGVYDPRGPLSWNDELLVGSRISDGRKLLNTLLRDAEMRVSEDGEMLSKDDRVPVEQPQPRRTQADENNDVKRLDRALDRTLYFVVQDKEGNWRFPTTFLEKDENLHEAAARTLAQTAGVNMNTWMIGRHPIAHTVRRYPAQKSDSDAKIGAKTFYLRGRIMAGQADLTRNAAGAQDYKWLTAKELETGLSKGYLTPLKSVLADR